MHSSRHHPPSVIVRRGARQQTTCKLLLVVSILKETREYATRAVASALVAGALWAAPAATTHVVLPIHHSWFATTGIASAKEMASASGSRVNKDAESLLRYGLPINNKEVCIIVLLLYCDI